jgi:hypothetical protein
MGRNESSVRKWVDRSDWPFSRDPRTKPWDVEKVKAWAEIQLKPDPAAAYRKKIKALEAGTGECAGLNILLKARTQATIERALLLRQRRLAEAGTLHDVQECTKRRLRQIHEVKAALMSLGRSLANSLVGQDADSAELILHTRCLQICEEFASDRES